MEKLEFGRLSNGRPVEKVSLKSKNGMTGEFLNYGCRIVRLTVPNRDGVFENVVLGHDSLAEYEAPGDVQGAVIGRFANRIAGGEFTVGGKSYHLAKNEGNNTLHSSAAGFQNRLWQVKETTDGGEPSVTFSLLSPDGDGGFPGNLRAEVTYTLTEDRSLRIDYRAETDAETPLNLTNHSYFNITGNAAKDVLGMELRVFSDAMTEADGGLIPTGRLLPVEGTPFDFRSAVPIGSQIGEPDPFLVLCGGYDVNYALNGPEGIKKAAELFDPQSGRVMLVMTDLPGIQVYTANSFAPGTVGFGGIKYQPHHAVCLETQYFPDSPHRPDFPYRNLVPGQRFHSATIFRFECR
ncbi:aldose epimerase family protein [Caproicibacter fermentans]|uniref:Aldose 1-epimerase n=1 Tax=Caproicibacter fermentans TaxID=2576756 RepID=A0A7G8TA78_9FIRM|nr:aldose epimerase family protein [Caproicibacter fermentans]QNK40519.1 galactose mutarotase [Caproicibacter fermentans]